MKVLMLPQSDLLVCCGVSHLIMEETVASAGQDWWRVICMVVCVVRICWCSGLPLTAGEASGQ